MLQDAHRITSYKKKKLEEKRHKIKFIIEENHQQFSRIFTNNVVAKTKIRGCAIVLCAA